MTKDLGISAVAVAAGGGYRVLKKTRANPDRAADVLEKLLVFQLYALGAPQDRIAKAVGRQKAWVNKLVSGLPKGGRSDGNQAQGKRVKKRPRRR